MQKRVLLILSFLFFLFIFSCASSRQKDNASSITEIKWGKSFGMCRGYCFSELTIDTDSFHKHTKSWQPEKYPAKDTAWKSDDWSQISALADFSKFSKLEERIGCPDCADGGAEWVEMKTSDNTSYKVTFEFGTSPEGLERLLDYLRANYSK